MWNDSKEVVLTELVDDSPFCTMYERSMGVYNSSLDIIIVIPTIAYGVK